MNSPRVIRGGKIVRENKTGGWKAESVYLTDEIFIIPDLGAGSSKNRSPASGATRRAVPGLRRVSRWRPARARRGRGRGPWPGGDSELPLAESAPGLGRRGRRVRPAAVRKCGRAATQRWGGRNESAG